MTTFRSRALAATAAAAVLMGLGAGGAVAAGKIDGHDIKQATIGIDKLSGPLHDRINASLTSGAKGATGAKGADGATGASGSNGTDGVAGKDGSVGPAGRDGLDGAPGKDGHDGAPGKDGADGVSGYEIVVGELTTTAPGKPGYIRAACPAGKTVIGGGYNWREGDFAYVYLAQPEENAFVVRVAPTNAGSTFIARAVCVSAN